ncbi:MAG: hypothetical protein AAFR16_04680 [Pseudomonadota bacterium]
MTKGVLIGGAMIAAMAVSACGDTGKERGLTGAGIGAGGGAAAAAILGGSVAGGALLGAGVGGAVGVLTKKNK